MIDSIDPIQPRPYLDGQIDQIHDMLSNDTFFPKGIHIDDIDRAIKDKISNDFQITSKDLNGQMIPVFTFFSLQSYNESIKTWQYRDNKKALVKPFIALVRDSIVDKGTNLGTNYNIASNPTYTIFKRPIIRNGRISYDYFQIPQPINLDIKYKLHIFAYLQRDCNAMDEIILSKFKSAQYYISVFGHYMPLKLDSSSDESEISDIDKKRYYHNTYDMTLKGYLLNEKDFKKIPSVDRIKIIDTPCTSNKIRDCVVDSIDLDCDKCLSFKFNRRAPKSKTIRVSDNIRFYYDNMSSGSTYNYFLNGSSVALPFDANIGDELTVAHDINYNGIIEIKVCGEKL